MAGSRRWAAVAAIAGVLAPAAAQAAPPFPSHDVRIAVTVTGTGSARVEETYVLDADARDVTFELLDSPCSAVGPVAAVAGGRALTLDVSQRGPWTYLHGRGGADRSIRVRYDVSLDGADPAVPIVLPAATLEPAGRQRGADVALQVAFANAPDAASVVLPRLERSATPGTWRAHMLAIPSAVRVRVPGAGGAPCARVRAGATGGIEWRFWVFVLTMAAWIPIYFWWFGRRDDAG